jgi:CBS domain-containing protein
MRVREVMTRQPICCLSSDTVLAVSKILRDEDIGSMPIVSDSSSRRLEGIITDRDLVCRIVSEGLDPRTTIIESFITRNPVTCRPEQSLESCEKLMQTHRVRRVPVVDKEGRCVGMLSQADVARSEQAEKVHKMVAEISRPSQPIIAPASAA